MSCPVYCNMQNGLGAHGALVPHFPESLTRKLYKKKIPEMTRNVPQVPRKIIPGFQQMWSQRRSRRTQERKERITDDDNH